jgi:outer membrane protein OmpA-like peptidoglycan-associated protein
MCPFIRNTLGVAAAFWIAHPALAAREAKTDHPLVTPYAGSSIYSKDVKAFDAYRVFQGWDATAKAYKTQTLEGKVTKLLYTNPAGRSVLELYRNYESALKNGGVTVLYECDQANMECVDGYVGSHLRSQFGINGIGNKSGRLMFARLEQDAQTAYLLLAVGDKYTDVHVVEMKKMQTGMAALNLQALTGELDKQGFVVVEGIFFDTDKTDLKPASNPALEEVAKLLKERPQLSLYVVGHTDSQGSLAHNLALSEGRANAVVQRLVKNHAVAAQRLEGRGVGPLAPVASNVQEDGRAKNRRVVLVQR